MTPDEFVEKGKIDPVSAEKDIISFVSTENARCEKGEITAATVGNALKAIRLLLEMNDVSLNWKKIRRILPRARRYALDRTPTEIQEIIEAADLRGKALTLVLISSGIREGAVQYFKIRDYTRIEQEGNFVAGRLTVYNGDPERYATFITVEACNAINKYVQFRTEHGETISSDSPLFRDKFDPIKGQYGHGKKDSESVVIPMTAPSVRQYYNRLLFSIGIRSQKKRRHEFSVHGFRKYFKTRAEQSGMKPINVELLMGHSVGISDSYYRPTENELLEDYLRATDALTISQEKHLRHEVENLKVENAEIERIKAQMSSMQAIIASLGRLGNDEIDSIYVGDEGKIYETRMFDPVTKKQYESNAGHTYIGNLKQAISDEKNM
ncbi:MAG: site-specific integrase, partial [Thermoproteota archaeon]|nr:site-specific integrase [Thermoproteota archaeon]